MAEKNIQQQIRLAMPEHGTTLFRANVGQSWTGNDCQPLADGSMLIRDARPFTSGLPAGFSDLFGLHPVVITPEMVGQTVAVFCAIEVKAPRGKPTEQQHHFIDFILSHGGRAGVARSVEDARKIIDGR